MTDYYQYAGKRNRQQATVIKIELTGKTLYLSDVARTIGGVVYEGVVLSFGDVSASLDCDCGLSKLSDFEFVVANRKLQHQAAGKKFADLFISYNFVGAKVTVTQHLTDVGGTSWASRGIFYGELQQPKMDGGIITLLAIASTAWDAPFPSTVFRKEESGFANLPDAVAGAAKPVIFGDWWNAAYSGTTPALDDLAAIGMIQNTVPTLLTEARYDTGTVHLQATGHKCKTFDLTDADGVFMYLSAVNELGSVKKSYVSSTNDASGLRLVELSLPLTVQWAAKPMAVYGSNYASIWQNAADGNVSTYVEVDVTVAKQLYLLMQTFPDMGKITGVEITALTWVTTPGDQNFVIGVGGSGTTTEWTAFSSGGDLAPVLRTHVVSSSTYKVWDWSGFHLTVAWLGTATYGVVWVEEARVRFEFEPSLPQELLQDAAPRKKQHLWGG